MAGLRFGRLVGVAYSHTGRGGRAHWLFLCDCGAETVADGTNVRSGGTASCGCLHREISAERLTTHGHRGAGRHGPTYRAWQLMNGSCGNPAVAGWKHCGGRGIAVAARWRHDYPAFLADMGERPAGTVLARRDAGADFSTANCFWADGRSRAERAAAGARYPAAGSMAGSAPSLPAGAGGRSASVSQANAGPWAATIMPSSISR